MYLDKINKWTEENLMELNAKKTKAIFFNFTKKQQFTTNLSLKNHNIENVKQTKLLGLILTSDLKWEENTNFLVKESNQGKYIRKEKLTQALNCSCISELNTVHLQ